MKSAFLLLALLLVALVPCNFAVTSTVVPQALAVATVTYMANNETNVTIAPTVTEADIDQICYKPTRITFNYAYTHSHDITNITTIGASDYVHSGEPTYFEFIARDIDDYTFSLILRYEIALPRTVLIGLFSGNLPAQGFAVKGNTTTYIVNVSLKVTSQPSFPSPEDVAKEVMRQVEQSLVNQTEENQKLMEEVRTTTTVNSALSVVSLILVLVIAILTGSMLRSRRPE